MEHFELIKKNSGRFAIPFIWIAYYIDYGVTHVGDRTLESATFLGSDIILGVKTVGTIFLVAFVLLLLLEMLHFFSSTIRSNIPYLLVAIVLFCFGIVGLFKEMEEIPFKEVNLFWHLGSLASAIWLFGFLGRIAENEKT